jgi:hypothetical protein
MAKWLTSEVTQPTRPSYYVPLTRGSREVDLARVRTGQVRCQGAAGLGWWVGIKREALCLYYAPPISSSPTPEGKRTQTALACVIC